MGMGIVLWKWEGMGTEIVLPAHFEEVCVPLTRKNLRRERTTGRTIQQHEQRQSTALTTS